MTIAQRNSDPVGDPTWGRGPTFKEKVPKPVRLSSPTKIRAPTPAESNPGTSTNSIIGPPRPAISIRRKAPTMGEPKSVAMAAKLPATPITTTAIGGASRLNRCIARTPRPLPIAISGASGPNTAPRLSVAKAAATMPKSSTGAHRPAGLETLRGLVAARSGQVTNGQSDEQPAQRQPRQRPPQRLAMEPDAGREIDEDLVLELGHGVQEEVGDRRHGDTDDGAQEEQDDVAPGPDDRRRVRGRRAGPVPDRPGLPGRSLSPPTTLHSMSGLAPRPRTDDQGHAQRLLAVVRAWRMPRRRRACRASLCARSPE